ncbi:HAAS signaling domain-containing protein [Micromonospora sp. NBC_01813]|uniref:HAAS signaling domain-containing protein n=1 Tax=Micromonospora sp. NBC_01813 TaxID=2975988 RepID=UPI002DDAEE8E|nr:hypothetical protein [Micromonospora sp. NBC_01813]WSA06488.1 hypothetical protein OG958_19520 [Micromonospora sp. NBC_01813]
MSSRLDRYQQELTAALRSRRLPGPRIAEALAEVESHVLESGEDPRSAFGEPADYADELAGVLGRRRVGWTSALALFIRAYGVVVLLAVVGTGLMTRGFLEIEPGRFGLLWAEAIPLLILGQAVLLCLGVWIVRRVRRQDDRVLDPRTGADMAPPVPWLAVAVIAAGPVVLALGAGYVLATRA